MQYALVISNSKIALAPCHPARARKLLKKGKASLHRLYPFTIRLYHEPVDSVETDIEIKIDPGSRTTGFALVQHNPSGSKVVYGINLHHRGLAIKSKLESRRAIRQSRRHRKTRYRQARFKNRTRPKGWIPPSLLHRVLTVQTWIDRLMCYSHVTCGSVEEVKFDTHKLKNPDVAGFHYQQGTLFNTQMREYLLEKYNRTCVYCSGVSGDKYLEWEHVIPKSKNGTDSSDNALLACSHCNKLKSNYTLEEWLTQLHNTNYPALPKHRKVLLTNIPKIIKRKPVGNLRDAAVMNAIRYKLGDYLSNLVPFQYHSSWLTKVNRKRHGYPKDHWVDAAVLGKNTVSISPKLKPAHIHCVGHGDYQMTRVNKYGFPRTSAKTLIPVFGFSTGDLVKINHPTKGKWVGKIMIRASGYFDLSTRDPNTGLVKKINSHYTHFTKLQAKDGYTYSVPAITQFIANSEQLPKLIEGLGIEIETIKINSTDVKATVLDVVV